ncbi:hypothetical protein CRG98_001866 [Punica granatum]|uniref:Reverse transcriptase domain-containing protein n=1 Tax=Punica granatum TaxID=22663 RepID=A0A2I0LAN7_PUNGR|nr:hypothetical protein CRG98_001866 [Punica granatum]
MDRATALSSRLDYAKVCVEVDAEKEIPNVLNVDLGNEYKVEVLVDTPWLPEKCARCKVFGHNYSSTLETAPPEVTEGSMAPADGSAAAKDPTVFKTDILRGPGMATSSRSDVVKVARNAELVTIVQLAAKKKTDNAINNSEELTSNIAIGCPVEEDDAGAARNDLNKGKNKVSTQGDFPQVDNKPTGIGLVGDQDNETNSDDDLEVMESRVKDSRQLRSTSMEVAKLVKRVQVKEIDEVKVVRREITIDQSMRDFTDFITSSELKDHPFTGCYFTWSNKRQEGFQARKIDRAMELDLRVKLSKAIDKEEKLLKQKSRVAWLKAGDQNTAFFHRAELLGRKDDRVVRISIAQLSHILKRKVSHAHYQSLLSPITEEEIKAALFSMGNDKSPGPDGFTGRKISDNVLLAHKLVRNYHRQGITPRCAIKIDLMKAFDSLNWDFLLNSLEAMGFPLGFLRWIKGCITSPYFSVAINGTLAGYFAGKRGLRQGDPLSPYLFVIAMEVFSNLSDSAVEEGRVRFHP